MSLEHDPETCVWCKLGGRAASLPTPPAYGGPHTQNPEWARYRHHVREIAERWCDQPTVEQDPDAPELTIETSCDACPACEARELVLRGEA